MIEWFFNYSTCRECIIFLSSLVVLFDRNLLELGQLFLGEPLWWGDNFLGEQFSLGANILGGNCLRGNYLGGNHPGVNYLGCKYPGTIFLGGTCPRTLSNETEPLKHIHITFWVEFLEIISFLKLSEIFLLIFVKDTIKAYFCYYHTLF